MMDKKTNMTISFNQTQMDMFDFTLEIIKHSMHNRTSYLLSCIREDLKNFLDLPDEVALPDEQLLELAIQRNENNIKAIIGEENYKKLYDKEED